MFSFYVCRPFRSDSSLSAAGNAVPTSPSEAGHTAPKSPVPISRADTDLVFPNGSTKLMLTHQRSIVRGIVHDAIDILRAFLLFRNAFPDVPTAISFAREPLSVAAGGYQPGGLLVRNRLQEDDEYALKLISLVCS